MSNKIWILLMFDFVICSRSSDKFCMRRYVNGKWISTGVCGGSERVSKISSGVKMETENKGWTVFQRRKNGNVDFYRNWDDYVKGFGNRKGDFWLGLGSLHEMTKGGNMELKIIMISRKGVHSVANYGSFRVGPGSDNYRLHVSGYSGNATYGDGLSWNNNRQFSTHDADHDRWASNCASLNKGGWWYDECFNGRSNLNGNFNKTREPGIWWRDYSDNLLRFSEMKFREGM